MEKKWTALQEARGLYESQLYMEALLYINKAMLTEHSNVEVHLLKAKIMGKLGNRAKEREAYLEGYNINKVNEEINKYLIKNCPEVMVKEAKRVVFEELVFKPDDSEIARWLQDAQLASVDKEQICEICSKLLIQPHKCSECLIKVCIEHL
jgi:hypothetical protein